MVKKLKKHLTSVLAIGLTFSSLLAYPTQGFAEEKIEENILLEPTPEEIAELYFLESLKRNKSLNLNTPLINEPLTTNSVNTTNTLSDMKFQNYFYVTQSKWIVKDNNDIALQLKPIQNSPLRTSSGNDLLAHATKAYSLVYEKFSSSSQWKNSTGMSHQFHCHANFAGDKEFWNLEPHRTSTNYLEYLRHGCNPEN